MYFGQQTADQNTLLIITKIHYQNTKYINTLPKYIAAIHCGQQTADHKPPQYRVTLSWEGVPKTFKVKQR